MRTKQTYQVDYERDESGWWIASVAGVKGCHTQGRTVDEARRRIREALGLFVGDADSATLVDHVKLPAGARRAIETYLARRRRAEHEYRRAGVAARQAVQLLQKGALRMSARDAGELLGLSHQRVHQLAHDPHRASGKTHNVHGDRTPARGRTQR